MRPVPVKIEKRPTINGREESENGSASTFGAVRLSQMLSDRIANLSLQIDIPGKIRKQFARTITGA